MKGLTKFLLESLIRPGRIFIIIKPGFFDKSQDILNKFEKEGWEIERQSTKKLLASEAKKIYAIHKNEEWFDELIQYMTSGQTTAYILINKNIKMSKQVFDDVSKLKDSIRSEFGESEMRNVIHSSDSYDRMIIEAPIYFSYLTV